MLDCLLNFLLCDNITIKCIKKMIGIKIEKKQKVNRFEKTIMK
jgi:hypothetical protein